jgi:hypothetical protein
MRHRHLSLVIAVLALGLAPCIAWAQDDPAKAADAKAMLATMAQVFSSPEIPPSLPVTPERLALVRQCFSETNAVAAFKALSDLNYSEAEAQIATALKGLPKPQQSSVMAAFVQSYKAAEANLQARVLDEIETYYTARMTDDELKTVISFYSSGVGYKMTHGGGGLTVEERQKSGQYMFSNPAMVKFVKLNFVYLKGAQARRQASQASFTADFKARFCEALANDRLTIPTCAARLPAEVSATSPSQ